MSSQTRYSLFVLASAILAACSWLLTEIALRFLRIDPIHAALGANLSGGLILLAAAGAASGPGVPVRLWPAWQWRDWGTIMAVALAIYTVAFQFSFNAVGLIGSGKVVLLGRLLVAFGILMLQREARTGS